MMTFILEIAQANDLYSAALWDSNEPFSDPIYTAIGETPNDVMSVLIDNVDFDGGVQ